MKYALFILALLVIPALALAQDSSGGFVPLTNIPALYQTGNAFDLSQFLNTLYRICIGAAAVIAVLQIMRAGIMYMGGDSVTEKKEAKNLIGLSIAGLILVLSPVIVFSLVNPEILSLKIGRIEELNVDLATSTASTTTPLPSTEQGVCSVQYAQLGRSMSECSAIGPDWETTSLSCCSHLGGQGFCCGRKASAPPPPPVEGFSYQIAVRQQNLGTDAIINGPYCIKYESQSFTGSSASTQCGTASVGRTSALTTAGTPHALVRTCAGETNPLPLELRDLQTCAP
jgi:hypothetical protein